MRGTSKALLAAGLALALGLGGASAAEASTAAPKASFSLSISYGGDLGSFQGSARFHGTVTGVATSTVVQVQRRTAGGVWRTLESAKTVSHGTFAGTFTPSGLGRTTFRAHVPATRTRAAINSASRVLTVSELFQLDSIPLAHPADGVSFGAVPNSDGQVVPHTIVMDGAAVKSGDVTATWTIGSGCSKMLAEVGPDGDEDGLVAEAVVGEGKHDFSISTVASGGFDVIQTPVAGARTLSLTTSIRKPGTGGQKVAWIFASVLCSVDPRSL